MHFNPGRVPVWYNKVAVSSKKIENSHILIAHMVVLDIVNSKYLQREKCFRSNFYYTYHIRIISVWCDKITVSSKNIENNFDCSYDGSRHCKLRFFASIKVFHIKLILCISSCRLYQFEMTKSQLQPRTLKIVTFWLLIWWFLTI